jgi:hypothetical protein
MVSDREDKTRNASILFFTDGVPNISPPRGEHESMKKIKRQKKATCPIHTYGFGQYMRLNSELLYSISIIFGAMHGYIPDPTNIGTTFVNAIANILTTAALDVSVDIGQIAQSCVSEPFIGDFIASGTTVNVGQVRFGQPIDLIFKIDPSRNANFSTENLGDMKIKYESNG